MLYSIEVLRIKIKRQGGTKQPFMFPSLHSHLSPIDPLHSPPAYHAEGLAHFVRRLLRSLCAFAPPARIVRRAGRVGREWKWEDHGRVSQGGVGWSGCSRRGIQIAD